MKTEQNETQNNEEVMRPGDVLRQAREQQGYSQKDIASRLRLRQSVIDDIENNQFDTAGPSATFTRGYIRSYAKFVGADENALLGQLDQLGHAQPQEQEMQSFSRRTKREKHDNRIMTLTWVLGAVFVGLTAWWWWQSQQISQEAEIVSVTSEAQALDESLANANALAPADLTPASADVAAANNSAVIAQPETPAVEPVTDATPLPDLAATFTPDTPATTESEDEVVLEEVTLDEETTPDSAVITADLALAFSGDCWIDIRDASGKRLDTGIKKAGDNLNLNGTAPYKIVLGAPGVVKMHYKGELVDLSSYPAGKVARLKLPQ
ncbi:XRE family transcriptional regulator [Photobacterium jeanii]|uniref:XRE family transcriptional regulator n=1 Tax=Photobacterium jeanii TaxID=858640 RepID=A0A178KC90_9GAMM|nr:cytoskeleton protein RodZ [Photobacterium jeanii]OAN14292.1 XRE family transcriptional regulator [Photobacterium jeanii]PST89813.1 cytoskeleton protein RodZ [Photobacterium jeanii]